MPLPSMLLAKTTLKMSKFLMHHLNLRKPRTWRQMGALRRALASVFYRADYQQEMIGLNEGRKVEQKRLADFFHAEEV